MRNTLSRLGAALGPGVRVRVVERDHCVSGGHGLVLSGPKPGYDRATWLYEVLVDGDDTPWWMWNDAIVPLTAIERLGELTEEAAGRVIAKRQRGGLVYQAKVVS